MFFIINTSSTGYQFFTSNVLGLLNGVRYFPKGPEGQFPKGIFPSGNSPNVQFPKRQLPNSDLAEALSP